MHSIVGLLSGWKRPEKAGSQPTKDRQPNPQEVVEKNLASLKLEQAGSGSVFDKERGKTWDSSSAKGGHSGRDSSSINEGPSGSSNRNAKFSDDSAYVGDAQQSRSERSDTVQYRSSADTGNSLSISARPSIDTGNLASTNSNAQDTVWLSSSVRECDTSSAGAASDGDFTNMYRVPRGSTDRVSRESRGSAYTGASSRSRRSSFALERASFESNRASLELFKRKNSHPSGSSYPESLEKGTADERSLCLALKIPEGLWPKFIALGVIPNDTPVPMSMLCRLWNVTGSNVAEKLAEFFTAHGIMKVATLSNNTVWALVQPGHLKALQGLPAESLVARHQKLIKAYEGQEHQLLADVEDDGYIMQNVGHHLLHTRALKKLRALLMRPAWLEFKLHSYGVASVVSDFRRYLMVEHDEGIKLLLEAFQMSVSACLAHPDISILRQQLQGRLQLNRNSVKIDLDLSPLHLENETQQQKQISLTTCTPSLEQAGGLQRMTLRGHTAGVRKVLVTPGGVDAITGSADGTARVWDMEIGDCVLLLDGHTAPVTDLAISDSGSILATASEDSTVRIWDMEEGTCVNVLIGHSGNVRSIALDGGAKIALSAGDDGTGRVWNLATGDCVQLLLGHTSLGALYKVILTKDGLKAITCSADCTARVWEVFTGRCLHTLTGHTGAVVDAALSSDGSIVATAGHDTTARVWSMLDGRCIHILAGHSGQVNAIRIAPHNLFLITVSDDYTSRVFELKSGRCMHILEGHGGWIADCAITPSCSTALTVAGDDLAVVWDLPTGTCQNVLEGHSDEVLSVELTRKGRFAVTGSMDGTAKVWDLQAKSTHLQQAHSGRVHGLAVTPDHSKTISFGDDGCLIWDSRTKQCTGALSGPAVRWVACLGSGDKLLCAGGDKTTTLWDLGSRKSSIALEGSRGSRVKSWSASKDGRIAAVLLFDSTVTVWDLEKHEQISVLQRWGQRDEASGHTGGINSVVVTADGQHVLTVSKDCTARVWDIREARTIDVLSGHTDGITGVITSEDSQFAVTLAYDNTARLWDLAAADCIGIMQHHHAVTKAVFSPDSRLLVTAAADNVAYMWRLEGRQYKPVLKHVYKGHTEELMGLAISSDACWVATCGRDHCLRLWNTNSGSLKGFFVSDTGLTCCTFTGDCVVAGDESGIIHQLSLPKETVQDDH